MNADIRLRIYLDHATGSSIINGAKDWVVDSAHQNEYNAKIGVNRSKPWIAFTVALNAISNACEISDKQFTAARLIFNDDVSVTSPLPLPQLWDLSDNLVVLTAETSAIPKLIVGQRNDLEATNKLSEEISDVIEEMFSVEKHLLH